MPTNLHRKSIEPLERRILLTTYYVSPGGSDAAAGNREQRQHFATLQQAANQVVAGDTVDVLSGTYHQGFVLGWDNPQNGTPSAPITFNAEPGAIITGRNNKTADAIDLEGASCIIVEGFTITNPSAAITRAGIRSVTNQNVIIRNNNVDGMGTWGIFTAFSDDIVIEDNTASHSQSQHGIYVSNSSQRPVIRGNTLFGNNDCGLHMNGDVSQGGVGVITGLPGWSKETSPTTTAHPADRASTATACRTAGSRTTSFTMSIPAACRSTRSTPPILPPAT